jgi:hypothetical protein
VTTEPEKIYQPWSDEEVVLLRAFQSNHPAEALFCQLPHYAPPTTPLMATILGMTCPEEGCGGTQEWAYAYMLEGGAGS